MRRKCHAAKVRQNRNPLVPGQGCAGLPVDEMDYFLPPKILFQRDVLPAFCASSVSDSSLSSVSLELNLAASSRMDCVMGALGACSIKGTPLLRTSDIVR